MYSLIITVISIDKVAKLMRGELQQYVDEQKTFIASVGNYRSKITGSCEPKTGPPSFNCVTTYFRTIFVLRPSQSGIAS